MTKAQLKKAERINRSRIEQAYYAKCSGIQISMMDMGSIFKVGEVAIAAGADDAALQTKIFEYVQTIRKN